MYEVCSYLVISPLPRLVTSEFFNQHKFGLAQDAAGVGLHDPVHDIGSVPLVHARLGLDQYHLMKNYVQFIFDFLNVIVCFV